MDYIGSKEKLNQWLFAKMLAGQVPSSRILFFDACAGSGAVSRYAAGLGLAVVSTDLFAFSAQIVRGSSLFPLERLPEAEAHINKINALPPLHGFFTEHYSELGARLYFSVENTQQIDAARAYLETIEDSLLRSYLFYCGLEALSRVSNTAGVQAAYLKKLKERAQRPLTFRLEKTLGVQTPVEALTGDILKTLRDPVFRATHQEDILYIDPPYNERQYGPNYHLYETFVLDDDPEIRGKTGIRDWANEHKSDFCSRKTCLTFIQNIIEATSAHKIFISYNSDGLIPEKEMVAFLVGLPGDHLGVSTHALPQRRYKSDTSDTRTYNEKPLKELLFEIEKL